MAAGPEPGLQCGSMEQRSTHVCIVGAGIVGLATAYALQQQARGVARAQPGRGIRESYLGFGVRNVAGADFEIERIEVQTHASATRRV